MGSEPPTHPFPEAGILCIVYCVILYCVMCDVYWVISANLHPSPTPGQLQPLTLKTGPNWPKYAPFPFPEGLGTSLGEPFFAIVGPQSGHFGGQAHLRPKQPKTDPNGPKRGKSGAFRGAIWVTTGPKQPKRDL